MPNKKKPLSPEELSAKGERIVRSMLDVCEAKRIFTYDAFIQRGRKFGTPFYAGMFTANSHSVTGLGTSASLKDNFQLELERNKYGGIKDKLKHGKHFLQNF